MIILKILLLKIILYLKKKIINFCFYNEHMLFILN